MSLNYRLRRAIYAPLSPGPPSNSLPRLFFLHVPKCGGTSVDEALHRAYRQAGHPAVPLDVHGMVRAAEATGASLGRLRKLLLLYFMAGGPHRYLTGHFSYAPVAWEAFGAEWQAITLLRDPVARWFSQYFYNKYKEGEHFRIGEPLSDFVETPRAQHMGADYVTLLVGGGLKGAAEPGAVQQALDALGTFAAVGVLERLDAFIREVEGLLGQRLRVRHLNKNPRGAGRQREEVTGEVVARVRALCAPNLQVYDAVASALQRRGSWSAVTSADLVGGGPAATSPT